MFYVACISYIIIRIIIIIMWCRYTLFVFDFPILSQVVAQIKRRWQFMFFRTRANSYTATTVSVRQVSHYSLFARCTTRHKQLFIYCYNNIIKIFQTKSRVKPLDSVSDTADLFYYIMYIVYDEMSEKPETNFRLTPLISSKRHPVTITLLPVLYYFKSAAPLPPWRSRSTRLFSRRISSIHRMR